MRAGNAASCRSARFDLGRDQRGEQFGSALAQSEYIGAANIPTLSTNRRLFPRVRGDVAARCANHEQVTIECHGLAETIADGAICGAQRTVERPAAAATAKNIYSTGVDAPCIGTRGTDHGPLATECYRVAEVFVGLGEAGGQFSFQLDRLYMSGVYEGAPPIPLVGAVKRAAH